MDSLQVFGGHPWDKNDPHYRRFLHDLDTYTPAQETPGLAAGARLGRRYKPDSDDDFLRILEESRLEYEADKRMQTGIVTYSCNICINNNSLPSRSGIGKDS